MKPEKLAPRLTLSRRDALIGGASIFAVGTAEAAPASLALAAIERSTHSRFMRMSTLLINHQLHPDVGARIVAAAAVGTRIFLGYSMRSSLSQIANRQLLSRISLATFLTAISRTLPIGLFLPGTAVARPKKPTPRCSLMRTH